MKLRRGVKRMTFVIALVLVIGAASGLAQNQNEITVAPEILQQYVGVYELAPAFKIAITVDGNQLMTQATGQAKLPLYASSETKFFLKVVDARIEFLKDAQGVISSLKLYQNNQEMSALRISDKVEERKAIELSHDRLEKYVGTYEVRPGFDLMITLEENQLMAQATGQGRIPIFAETDTRFFAKTLDVQIEFLKDDKGAVTHLMLHQGPAELKAPRK